MRPTWTFDPDSYETFLAMRSCMPVNIIRTVQVITSADTAKTVYHFYREQNLVNVMHLALEEKEWENVRRFFEVSLSYKGVLEYSTHGKRALQIIEDQEKYDEEHEIELQEYKRLKAKFGEL